MTLCQQGLGEDIFSSAGHKVKNLVRFGIGEWRAALREAFSRRNVLASRRFWFSHLRMVYHCHNAPDGPWILMKPICPVFSAGLVCGSAYCCFSAGRERVLGEL